MTILARLLSSPAGDRLASARATIWALALIAGVSTVLAFAAPAGAVVAEAEGVKVGVQPRKETEFKTLYKGGPLDYHGGPVLHSSDVYVVYWDPFKTYRGDWERLVDRFFQDVAAESGHRGDVFALDPMYSDATGRAANQLTFRGSVKDEDPYPTTAEGGNCSEKSAEVPVCLTDKQIRAELQHVIASVAPPLPGSSGTPIYYILTPPGVNVCTDKGSAGTCSSSKTLEEEVKAEEPAETGICGYHSAIAPEGPTPIPYVVQPWVAGDAGLFILSENPLKTSQPTTDALACQDGTGLLKEPNQLAGLNPFGNYAEGLADVIINDLSIEQRDVVTDPLLNGWYQEATRSEQGDMTKFNFGPPPETPPTPNKETHATTTANEEINSHSYYLAWAFDSVELADSGVFSGWSGVTLEPFFTAPSPVNTGDIVGFNGTESDITLAAPSEGLPADEPYTPPTFSWEFGDGSSAVSGVHDASVFHTYQYGGVYKVTLTVTDSGGNTESTWRDITVVGPAPPSAGSGGSGGAGAAGGSGGSTSPTTGQTGSGGGATHGGGAPPAPPAPIATDAVASRSLKTVAKKGVVIRYSVNQQVAGHFEILLVASLAHHLGISGSPAVGLPAGSLPEVVIGKALLVTGAGGHSTISIQFSKRTAQRLAREHKVTLMLRLIVRNATARSTTVLSTFTLTH